MPKKLCFKVPIHKYIEFKSRAACKYEWQNGYTSNAVNEAIDLWLLFEKMPGDMKKRHTDMLKMFNTDKNGHTNPIFTPNLCLI